MEPQKATYQKLKRGTVVRRGGDTSRALNPPKPRKFKKGRFTGLPKREGHRCDGRPETRWFKKASKKDELPTTQTMREGGSLRCREEGKR